MFKKHEKAQYDKQKKVINARYTPRLPKVRVHLSFAVKYDGRHKARLVADGHLAPEPVESIYAGVVSLRNLRLVIFLGKLTILSYGELILAILIAMSHRESHVKQREIGSYDFYRSRCEG